MGKQIRKQEIRRRRQRRMKRQKQRIREIVQTKAKKNDAKPKPEE